MTFINGCYAVAKDEYLIAVDPKSKFQDLPPTSGSVKVAGDGLMATGQDTENVTFKSLAWSQNIQVLGEGVSKPYECFFLLIIFCLFSLGRTVCNRIVEWYTGNSCTRCGRFA